jgi:hypothetical protein
LVVSSPVSGSVTAKQALFSPRANGGSQAFFCASVPKCTTGSRPKMFMWMVDAAAWPPHSATVRRNSAASRTPRPEPPYCSGMQMPSQPPLATASKNSLGNWWFLSLSRQ